MRLKPLSMQHSRLCGFVVMALSGSALSVSAQEPTPVRQLSQSTAANPYELAADGQAQRQKRDAPSDAIATTLEGEEGWWGGMEDVAKQSMDQSNWAFKFGVTAGYEYDSNYRMSQRGLSQETGIFSVSPYGTLTYGQPGHGVDFNIRYAPEYRWFTEESIESVLNHNLSTSIGLNGAHSRISLSANYAKNEGGNIEVGGLVTSDIYGFKLTGNYDLSPKTSLGGYVGYDAYEYAIFNSYEKFTAGAYMDYAVTPKFKLGVGLGYEGVDQDVSVSHDAFSVGLRVNWAITAKTGISGSISGEYREFEGGESITTPTFTLGAYYKPTPKVSTGLSLYRRANPSIGVVNTLMYATGAALSASYNISDRLSFSLSGGYEFTEYESSVGINNDREDKYLFIRPTIKYIFNSHLSANLFYQYSTNESSTGPASGFDRNQVGLYLSLAF